MKAFARLASLGLLLGIGQQALANPCPPGNPPTNCGPPTGPPVILDLAGQSVPHTYTQYSASFLATTTTTQLSFAFREDPAFLELDNVSVTTGGGPNLLVNGDFESGPTGSTGLTGWTALNSFGATFFGVIDTGCGIGGSRCWFDGSVQGYDGLNQSISTVLGDTYDVSFFLDDTGDLTTFRQLSNNGDTTDAGGNGIDLLLYAGTAIPTEGPPTVPEPASLALFGLGLAGLGLTRRRKLRA